MNEEEKKAIEYLKTRLYGNKGCKYIDVAQEDLRIFIKLVDRLQKENEELEEINNELEAEKNEAIRRYNFETIPVQKVKDKIEELNKQLEEDLQDEIKVNSNRFIIICQCKNCLQELLDGSDTSVGSIGSEE